MNDLYLVHHGIKGQKWGIRRYQNEDGTYTEAGRKRYALDRDVNDTRRTNVAKIRLGESRRRLDVAKRNSDGTNYTRIADLKSRERGAKRAVRQAKNIDKGAKLAAKGQTINGNSAKAMVAYGASIAASYGLTTFLNSRMSTLSSQGRWTSGHQAVAEAINNYGSWVLQGASTAYSLKQASNNRKLRAYNNAKRYGGDTIKYIGSQEYADRKAKKK